MVFFSFTHQMDNQLSPTLNYSSLEWRFQTQMASRSARDQLKPEIVLRFELKDQNNDNKYVTLVCDASNLVHIHELMEQAVMAVRSKQLNKMVRHNTK